jgi:hypothetical protein
MGGTRLRLGAAPKLSSRVEPQARPRDELAGLLFLRTRLWSLVALFFAVVGYALKSCVLDKYRVLASIAQMTLLPRVASYVGVGVALLLVAVLVGFATFALYMYFLARSWSPRVGFPENFITFKSAALEEEWKTQPIPVEVCARARGWPICRARMRVVAARRV